MQISLLGALIGGVLTVLSPCSVMLLPAFFSYAFADLATLIRRTGVFYLGLATTLVPLGLLAGTLGALVNTHRGTLIAVASIVVVILGLVMIAGIPIPGFSSRGIEGTSGLSVYALGTVYGLAGVCAGPLLGAVLTFAAAGANALYGGIVLLIFAAGMAVPLLVLALVWGRLPFVRKLVRPREVRIGRWRTTWTGIIGGLLTVAIGIFLYATEGGGSFGQILGASDLARIEGQVLRSTSPVIDVWVAVVGVVVAAVAVVVTRAIRSRRAVR